MVHEKSEMYNEVFTQWHDDIPIRFLDQHATYDQVRITKDDTQEFERILAFMHNFARLGATPSLISQCFTFLEKRYTTWKAIISYDGVTYDQVNNEVAAAYSVWDSICEEFELGKIYHLDGNEHMWEELNGIFGPDSVRTERNAQSTPFKKPGPKRYKEEEEFPDYTTGSRAMDCETRAMIGRAETMEEKEPENLFPKGQFCPYPGDWIHTKRDAPTGSSSRKGKEIKSKRNLNF